MQHVSSLSYPPKIKSLANHHNHTIDTILHSCKDPQLLRLILPSPPPLVCSPIQLFSQSQKSIEQMTFKIYDSTMGCSTNFGKIVFRMFILLSISLSCSLRSNAFGSISNQMVSSRRRNSDNRVVGKISMIDQNRRENDVSLASDVTSLTLEMMKIESISGNEGNVAKFLKTYLEDRGWKVTCQPVYDSDSDVERRHPEFSSFSSGNPRCNIYARWPGGDNKAVGPKVLLNSHIDTVPPYIPPTIKDGVIYGRGSCDAKGIIAAQVLAAEQLISQGFEDIGLLYVVGEETDHSGMTTANALGLDPDYLIVGEPTENRMITLQKGILKMQLRTRGVACHSGYPEIGHSAIDDMIEILHELKNTEWPASEEMGATTLNIGLLKGGQAANALAENCEATLMFRVTEDPLLLKDTVQRLVGGRGQISVITQNKPVHLHTCAGYETGVAAFNTDIAYFRHSGKSILLGPGSILDAHSKHEKIPIAELERAVGMYVNLVKDLLQGSEPAAVTFDDSQRSITPRSRAPRKFGQQ
mmetsp:Transcript_11429/g.14927  ORF Transcript_11429/g.14927 Transcript_11429/m.14927 type:complete len:527 (+) Transcript_11429:17-1597(+)